MGKLIKIYFIDTLKLDHFVAGPKKARMWGFAALMLFAFTSVMFSVGTYCYAIGNILFTMGATEVLLTMMMAAASVVALFTGILNAKGLLFGFKDFDFQMSLPIKAWKIVASRVAIQYIYDLFFCALIMLPSIGMYAYFVNPEPLFYLYALIAFLCTPAIPVVVAAVLGAGLSVLAARFRRTDFVRLIGMLILVFGIMALNFSMSRVNEQIASQVADLVDQFKRIYPPSAMYHLALGDLDFGSLLAFAAVSAAVFALFSLFIGRVFKRINTLVTARRTLGNFKLQEVRVASPMRALFVREIHTYFGIALYVFNTSFGMIILLLAAIASLFVSPERLGAMLGDPQILLTAVPMLPFVMSLLVGMTSTTACSVSIEGRKLWIVKSLPINARQILDAKLGVNLLITVPVVLASAAIFALRFSLPASLVFYLFLTPLVYAGLTSVMGLWLNLLLPKLDWLHEVQVIKQSASVLVAVLLGMLLAGLPIYLSTVFGLYQTLAVVTVAVALTDFVLYTLLLWFGPRRFNNL